jgi:hypothetical protein
MSDTDTDTERAPEAGDADASTDPSVEADASSGAVATAARDAPVAVTDGGGLGMVTPGSALSVGGDISLDEIMAPPASMSMLRATAWLVAPAAAAANALLGAGFEVLEGAEGARYAVVSTRVPRHRVADLVAHGKAAELDVVVLAHPGGEVAAVDAVRAGASAVIAEGDAVALVRMAAGGVQMPGPDPAIGLIEAYEARVVRDGGSTSAAITSPTSGLPSAAALEIRLASPFDTSKALRVICFRVGHFAHAVARMSPDAAALLARRLGQAFRTVCERHGELFDLGDGSYVLLGAGTTVVAAERLGRTLASIAESYTPDPTSPLAMAVGHAGPECSGDPITLRELAARAEDAAALEEDSKVLGAGELVGSLATATELEVILRLIDVVARSSGRTDREVIARVANEIALRLGFDGPERMVVRFVAHVADIGLVRNPVPADDPAWRDHPVEGSDYLEVTAGPTVARAVRSTHEHWDGSGFPDGLAGIDIPPSARIAAVAEALVLGGFDAESLSGAAGSRFDPSAVEAAVTLVNEGLLPS